MQTLQTQFAHVLDWNLLKLFDDIVKAGGITLAARESSRKQPALSLSLKRFEKHVGVRLCERGPRGFELTDTGERVAEICDRISTLVGEIPSSVANGREDLCGCVRIQVISNLVDHKLDEALAAFHARFPNVEMIIDVVTWEQVTNALLSNDIDVGIAPARFRHARLRYELLFREVHRAYCGRTHHLYGEVIDDPEQLAEEAFVLTGADEPDELTRYRLRHRLGERRAGASEHLEEAKRLAILGVGICFLPEAFAAPEVENRRLWPLTPTSNAPAMKIFVITNPRAPRHLAADRLLEALRFPTCQSPARKAATL